MNDKNGWRDTKKEQPGDKYRDPDRADGSIKMLISVDIGLVKEVLMARWDYQFKAFYTVGKEEFKVSTLWMPIPAFPGETN